MYKDSYLPAAAATVQDCLESTRYTQQSIRRYDLLHITALRSAPKEDLTIAH